jgi:hypothetical protein
LRLRFITSARFDEIERVKRNSDAEDKYRGLHRRVPGSIKFRNRRQIQWPSSKSVVNCFGDPRAALVIP